jgi:hypothetical protein
MVELKTKSHCSVVKMLTKCHFPRLTFTQPPNFRSIPKPSSSPPQIQSNAPLLLLLLSPPQPMATPAPFFQGPKPWLNHDLTLLLIPYLQSITHSSGSICNCSLSPLLPPWLLTWMDRSFPTGVSASTHLPYQVPTMHSQWPSENICYTRAGRNWRSGGRKGRSHLRWSDSNRSKTLDFLFIFGNIK